LGIYEQRGIGGSGMRRILPPGIRLDFRKGLVGQRLYPPQSAPREQYNPLTGPDTAHAALDRFKLVGVAFPSRRNPAELDGRRPISLLSTIAQREANHDHEGGTQNDPRAKLDLPQGVRFSTIVSPHRRQVHRKFSTDMRSLPM
jgi:hypothetical protein